MCHQLRCERRRVLKSHDVSSVDVHSDCTRGHKGKQFNNVTIDLETTFFFEENRQSLIEFIFTNSEILYRNCGNEIQDDEFCWHLRHVRSEY